MPRNEEAIQKVIPGQGDCLAIDLATVKQRLDTIRAFQILVRKSLVKDLDYGIIPGTKKPSLLKPGAEKVAKLLGLADSYTIVAKDEDWDKGFFAYTMGCNLCRIGTGELVSQGLGLANSKEAHYRYRWVYVSDLPVHLDRKTLTTKTIPGRGGQRITMFKIENDDPYSLVNTVLKVAKKRALVDAALSAGRLSNLFGGGDGDDGRDGAGRDTETPAAVGDSGDSLQDQKADLLKQIEKVLVDRWPNRTADDKQAKGDALERAFGTRIWKQLAGRPIDYLRPGLAVLLAEVEAAGAGGEESRGQDDAMSGGGEVA